MIKDYFRYTFPIHLRQLHPDHPFFLGNTRDKEETSKKWSWEDVIGEMQHIASDECPDFVCCLFFVLISGQAMFKYLERDGRDYEKGIMYPEFAVSGRSEDHENPMH